MTPNQLLAACHAGDGGIGWEIEKSLRFRGSNLASLTKTYPLNSDTSAVKKTYSFQVKRGKLGVSQAIMSNGMNGPYNWFIGFTATDQLQLYSAQNSVVVCDKRTTALFRDPSAWYHILVVVDVSSPITEERVKLYVNGIRITAFSTNTNPAQNNTYALAYLSALSGAYTAVIGGYNYTAGLSLEGYLAEIHVIDGQALTPSYFGQWSQESGQWVPIRYTGVYGNNGFYLDFKDNSALTNLGYDKSGLNNHWTPNNFSLTSGATYDSMLDTPTNNYATLNQIDRNANGTLGDANMSIVSSSQWIRCKATIGVRSGKWYWETQHLTYNQTYQGICDDTFLVSANYWVGGISGWSANYNEGGNVWVNNVSMGNLGASLAIGDILAFALDMDNGTLQAYKNGVLQGTVVSGFLSRGTIYPAFSLANGATGKFNFGQRPFAYTPPTGFKALCSKNLPTPAIKRGETGFDVATWTGNGGNIQIGEYQFPRPSYLIDKSLRFKGVNSYLSRTFAASNRTTWTWSGWVKRSAVDVPHHLFSVAFDAANQGGIRFQTDNSIEVYSYISNTYQQRLMTTRLFKEPSKWHHILVAFDTTQAVATDRCKLWVDGQAITSFSVQTSPVQNYQGMINSANSHTVSSILAQYYHNGYMAEMHFIDGQALTPASFGEFDINGYWIPKAYAGTYGQNGFYLDFEDTSAVSNLGFDKSGLGNNWAVNNFSLTTGATYDSMVDSPTANYAVLDALSKTGSNAVMSNGGLELYAATSGTAANFQSARATYQAKGKIYFEWTYTTGDAYWMADVGLGTEAFKPMVSGQSYYPGNVGNGISVYRSYGYAGTIFMQNNIQQLFPVSYNHGDTLAIAFDSETGKVWFAINGTWVNSGNPATGANPLAYINEPCWPVANPRNLSTIKMNFGQRPFTYTPPESFRALSIPNIAEYTEDLESPDLVWIKCRNAAQNHMLFDSVRGATKYLSSNLTAAEASDANSLISFNKNGFYLGNNANVNTLNNTYVAWMWKANQTQVANNDGTIASQVKVNQALGFSVVKYTGTGVEGSIGHGLGKKPDMIIVKNASGLYDWVVGHKDVFTSPYTWEANYYLGLNLTAGKAGASNVWSTDTTYEQFTSATFRVGNSVTTNGSGNSLMAYCFTEVEGYSKFGVYTGNGSADGPFVFTGMKPRFIMIKRIDAVNDWLILDTTRSDINNGSTRRDLAPNLAGAELTDAYPTDILSNGFKLRNVGNGYNVSSATYIFAAFAECPMKYSTAR